MIIIDPGELKAELLKKYPHIQMKKGITQVSFSEFMEAFKKAIGT